MSCAKNSARYTEQKDVDPACLLIEDYETMAVRGVLDTPGPRDSLSVDMSKTGPERLYQEGQLRAIGKIAHILYGSRDLGGSCGVEQVTPVLAVQKRY